MTTRKNSPLTCAHTNATVEKSSLLWVLEKFSRLGGRTLTSPTFSSVKGKCLWDLRLYPCLESKGEIFVGLALGMAPVDYEYRNGRMIPLPQIGKGSNLPNVSFKCLVMNSEGSPIAPVESWNENDYSYGELKTSNLIRREELLKKLADDVLKISVDVTASVTVTTAASVLQCPSVKIPSTTATLFETRKLSDFVIRVQETDLPVHKCILAAKSPVFEAMLLNDTKEAQTCLLELRDMELMTVQAMIKFFYVGEVSDLDVTMALVLLRAADKYNIVDLFRFCSRYLQGHLCSSNFSDILAVATELNASDLKEMCLKYQHK